MRRFSFRVKDVFLVVLITCSAILCLTMCNLFNNEVYAETEYTVTFHGSNNANHYGWLYDKHGESTDSINSPSWMLYRDGIAYSEVQVRYKEGTRILIDSPANYEIVNYNSDYYYAGWSEDPDAVLPDDSITVDRDLDLYAVWLPNIKITLHTDERGKFCVLHEGTGYSYDDFMIIKTRPDNSLTLQRNDLNFENYEDGWNSVYGNDVTGDMPLAPANKWVYKTYYYEVKEEYTFAISNKYYLKGWSTNKNATEPDETIPINKDIDLYAVYGELCYIDIKTNNNNAYFYDSRLVDGDEDEWGYLGVSYGRTIPVPKNFVLPKDFDIRKFLDDEDPTDKELFVVRDNLRFLGWSKDRKAEKVIDDIVVDEDGITLYAIWDRSQQLGLDGTNLGKGASAEMAESAIARMTGDKDLPGTVFNELQFKSLKQTKTSITLSWKNNSDAKKYVIYGNKCGKQNKMRRLAVSNGTSKKLTKVLGKRIKKGTYYKFIIVAYDDYDNVVSTSKTIYVATKGSKVGNHKSVAVKKSVLAKAKKLKKGKTLRLKAKAVSPSKKMKVKKYAKVRYETSNPEIAIVSKKGVVKGKKKGSCYIYAYAQNGVSKRIKVTVR